MRAHQKAAELRPGRPRRWPSTCRASRQARPLTFSMNSDILKERLEDSLAVAAEHLSESFTIVGKTTKEAKGRPRRPLYVPRQRRRRACT